MENEINTLGTSRIIANVIIDGFATDNILPNQNGRIIVKGSFNSYESQFHKYAETIKSVFSVSKHINNLLIKIDENNNAQIHEDNFPFMISAVAKKDIDRNSIVLQKDVFDVKDIAFKDIKVDLNPKDGEKIIWLFREGFTFGLYFDLTKKLNNQNATKEMAAIYSKVIYYDLYKSLSEKNIVSLINIGWFPFIHLINNGYEIINSLLENEKIEDLSKWIDDLFPNERVKDLTNNWFDHNIFKKRKIILSEGLECFYEGKYAACISTLTPLVEGIANLICLDKTGKGTKYNGDKISESIGKIAQEKYKYNSVAFPDLFAKYLKEHFFAHLNSTETDKATRHPLTHGRVNEKGFTREKSLQIILTLDQLRFYA